MYLKYYPFVPFFTMPGRIRLKIRIRPDRDAVSGICAVPANARPAPGPSICPDRFRFAGRFSYLCGGKMHVMKKGILYAVLASVLWAIVNPFIKQGLSYDFSPMNFAGLRFTVVGIILFAYTWHRGMWREIMQHRRLFGNLILINMFMGYTAFYFGVDFVSGAISSIIMGMTPLINVLLAHLLASNDRLNVHKIISLIVSLIGLLLIVGMGSNGAPLDWKGITGIVLLLLSIIFQGYSAISVSEDKGKINPIFLNAVQMFFGGLLIYMIGLGTEGYHSFIGKPAGFYISLSILVFISVFAFSFWFIALQSKGAKVSDINMCRLINPILGAILSWIMLPGEYPTFSTVAGMIIIVSSLIIYFKGAEIGRWLKRHTAGSSTQE